MIVFVETNFILELVLQQEEAAACEELSALCSSSGAHMVIPAFAIAEAGMKLERGSRERRNFLQTDLTRLSREMGRARGFERLDAILRDFDAELVRAERDTLSRWLDFRVTLDRVEVIAMTASTLDETIAIQVGKEIETLQDAIVLASVTEHLQNIRKEGIGEPACFVSRDGRAFGTRQVVQKLRDLNCRFLKSFSDAAGLIRTVVNPQ